MNQILVFVALLCSIAVNALAQAPAANNNRRVTAEDWKARFGLFNWGPSPYIGSGNLNSGNSDIKFLGVRNSASAMSPVWDPDPSTYPDNDLRPLSVKADRPDYDAWVRGHAPGAIVGIVVYDSTSYDPAISDMRYRHRELYTNDEWTQYLSKVYTESSDFAYEMMQKSVDPVGQSPRRIVAMSWEGNHDAPRVQDWRNMDGTPGPYPEYLRTRNAGYKAGRTRAVAEGIPGSFEIEMEVMTIDPSYNPDGIYDPTATPGIADYQEMLATIPDVDIWGYSSWLTTSLVYYEPDQVEAMKAGMKQALAEMQRLCKVAQYSSCRLAVQEFGYLYDQPNAATVYQDGMEAALEEGAEFIMGWVTYNDPSQGRLENFGSFDENGLITPQGELIQNIMFSPVVRRSAPVQKPVR